jgi:hypothetical protein
VDALLLAERGTSFRFDIVPTDAAAPHVRAAIDAEGILLGPP